jgi:hypothetical protein
MLDQDDIFKEEQDPRNNWFLINFY